MRFFRRPEIPFNSEMNLYRTALKPTAPTLCELGGLGNFFHAQNASEERARFFLLPGRHCQLNVVNGKKLRSTFRDALQCFLGNTNYFFGSGLAVGGVRPFRRR